MFFNQSPSRLRELPSPRSLVSWFVLLPLLALISGQTLAHDEHGQKKKAPSKQHKWSGSGKFSIDANAGNTNTGKIKGSAKLVYNQKFSQELPFRHNFGLSLKKGDNARTRDGERFKTSDKESADYRLDYFLTDRSSARAFAFYQSDKQAKVDSFTMLGVGYKNDFFKNKNHVFTISGGVSHVSLEYNDGTPTIKGPAGRVTLSYKGQITDKISANQRLVYLGMEGLTMKSSITSLQYDFTKKTAIVLDHEVTHYSSIADTAIDDTDDSTSLSFAFRF